MTSSDTSNPLEGGDANRTRESNGDPLNTGPYEPPGDGSVPAAELLPGTVLKDRYLLEKVLGRGGMGQVYLARDQLLLRPVAVKVIRPRDPELRNRTIYEAGLRDAFADEARIGANLTHPAIATVFDFGFHENEPFIVFEYIAGETLRDLLNRRGRLPLEEARLVLGSLAQALDFAHTQHVVHRDLKPENIRATLQSHFKVLDLGLAKEYRHAVDWSFAGTPRYASPEQVNGLPCDGRTDQYALALIAYEVITGHRAFDHEQWRELLEMHRTQEPPSPRQFLPELPETICTALARALQKDPSRRFATCAEFALAMGCHFLNAPSLSPEPLRETMVNKMSGQWTRGWRASRSLLMLTADSLWASYDAAVAHWPLQAVKEIQGGEEEEESFISLFNPLAWGSWLCLQMGANGLLRQSFRFYRAAECKKWKDHLEALRHQPQNAAQEPERAPRQETVILVPHRPSVRYQQLGTVEAKDSERWRAEARLRIRVAMLGADAVIDLREERLPSLGYTYYWLSGTAVRTVDPAGRGELWSRWLARELTWVSFWMLVLIGVSFLRTLLGSIIHTAVGAMGIGLVPAVQPIALQLGLETGWTALVHSWPLAIVLLLRWLLWPQLLRPAAITLLTLGVSPVIGLISMFGAAVITGKWQGAMLSEFNLFGLLVMCGFLINVAIMLVFTGFVVRKAWRIPFEYRKLKAGGPQPLKPLRRVANTLTFAASLVFVVLLCASMGWSGYAYVCYSAIARSGERDALDYFNQGVAAMAERPQEAEQAFRRALPLWQELTQATTAQPEYRHNLAATYRNLGLVLLRREAVADAEQAYRDALAQYDKLGTDFPTYHNHEKDRNLTRENLALLTLVKPFLEDISEQREASRLESDGQHQAAGVHLREALDRHEQRMNDFRDQDAYGQLLAAKCNRLAWFLARCPDVQVRNPGLAVELAQRAVEQVPRRGTYWNTLGAAKFSAGDWNGSITALEQSMRLRQGGDVFDWLFLAMAHHQLQHVDEAVAYLEKAVKWIEQAEKGQLESPSLQAQWQANRRNADLLRREAEELIRRKVPQLNR